MVHTALTPREPCRRSENTQEESWQRRHRPKKASAKKAAPTRRDGDTEGHVSSRYKGVPKKSVPKKAVGRK